jgi:hypothetical protein
MEYLCTLFAIHSFDPISSASCPLWVMCGRARPIELALPFESARHSFKSTGGYHVTANCFRRRCQPSEHRNPRIPNGAREESNTRSASRSSRMVRTSTRSCSIAVVLNVLDRALHRGNQLTGDVAVIAWALERPVTRATIPLTISLCMFILPE